MRPLLFAVAVLALTAPAASAATADGMDVRVLVAQRQAPSPDGVGFQAVNSDATRTMGAFELDVPRTVRIDPRGAPVCAEERVLEQACGPRIASGKLGSATITALGDPTRGRQFAVAVYRLDQDGTLGVAFFKPFGRDNFLGETTLIDRGRRGQRLRVKLPVELAGAPELNYYASLRDVSLYPQAQKGRRSFIAVRGCNDGAHRFRARFHFMANGMSPASDVTVKVPVPCE